MTDHYKPEKKTERLSENLTSAFYELMDVMDIAVWEFDLDYRVIRYNQKAIKIYGEELYDQYCYYLAAKRENVCEDCPARMVYEGQESGRSQHQRVDVSGNLIFIDHIATAIRDINGNLTGVLVLIIDITAQKLLEKDLRKHRDRLEELIFDRTQALQESETKYRSLYEESLRREALYQSLLNSSADAIVIYNLEGKLQYINPAFTQTFGWELDELKDREIPYVPDTEKASTEAEILRLLRTGEPSRNFSTKRLTKNGKLLNIDISASVYEDHEGNPAGLLVILRDVTQIRNIENQLRQAQKMESIGTLAGGIAHDFNNLLSPIVGNTELMLLHTEENSDQFFRLNKILSMTQRATGLVKQILTFSRQSVNELKPMSLHKVIEETIHMIRALFPSTIDIHHHIRKECGQILADPTQIHQVIMNLCTNALHAMEETGGSLILRLDEVTLTKEKANALNIPGGRYACLKITDTGIGINPNDIHRIFDPYYTSKKEGKGTGLGLAVVHGIVTSYKGTIKVKSTPGQGTTIIVYLPVLEKKSVEIHEKTNTALQKGQGRILVVDDQEDVFEMETEMLEYLGYQVTGTTSSKEALAMIQSSPERFDLVITDMTMPVMTGAVLARKLLAIRPNLPIILCTGFNESMTEKKAMEIGIKGFLMKPLTLEDLSSTIRSIFEKS